MRRQVAEYVIGDSLSARIPLATQMGDIHKFTSAGDARKVAAILRRDPRQIAERDENGDTPLHVAARDGQQSVVKTLLKNGADVNAQSDVTGKTALHYANHCVSVARLLVKHGAHLEALDKWGRTPIQRAASESQGAWEPALKVFNYLVRAGAEYDIESAITVKDAKHVQELLDGSPDLIAGLPMVEHARFIRRALDDPETMRILLEHGANPNIRIRKKSGPGATFVDPPICKVSDVAVAELLIQYGAQVDVKDSKGSTPLQRARKHKMQELSDVLAKHAPLSRRSSGRPKRSGS